MNEECLFIRKQKNHSILQLTIGSLLSLKAWRLLAHPTVQICWKHLLTQSLSPLPPDDNVDCRLHCRCSSAPPHCCCDGDFFCLFFVCFLFSFNFFRFYFPLLLSTSPGFLGSHSSSPLCSGMPSGINQSINHPLSRPAGVMSQLTVGRQFCVFGQDNQVLCVSKGVWLWLFLFMTLCVLLNDVDGCIFSFVFSCRGSNSHCTNKSRFLRLYESSPVK